MDRRSFLHTSMGAAAWMLARPTFAQDTNANELALTNLQEQPLHTVSFGSCNRPLKDQSYWPLIAAEQPQLWVWLGDNIYADNYDMLERQRLYQGLKDNPYYKSFRQQVPVIGTWDDHDFYNNDSDGDFAGKFGSKYACLQFLDVPRSHPVWGHEGIYQSYRFGPPGQRTQVIILDLRYNMVMSGDEKLRRMLGLAQWAWLEQEIRTSDADLLLIGSSLGVTSPFTALLMEGWNSFYAERRRLYELLAEAGIPTIFLTGDRHWAEVDRVRLPGGLPAYEVMSSGLTHADGLWLPHDGRISDVMIRRNYGVLRIDWSSSVGPQVRMQVKSAERDELCFEALADFSKES